MGTGWFRVFRGSGTFGLGSEGGPFPIPVAHGVVVEIIHDVKGNWSVA